MRSRSIVALCSLVALAAGAGGLSAQGRADSRPGLAVFPIWNSGSYGQDKENFDALQRGMAAMIISELAANPGGRVVEHQGLMTYARWPTLPRQASHARMSRQIPTDALTYYSRALLYQDRGQKDKAIDMYNRALEVFPQYAEATEGLQRLKTS